MIRAACNSLRHETNVGLGRRRAPRLAAEPPDDDLRQRRLYRRAVLRRKHGCDCYRRTDRVSRRRRSPPAAGSWAAVPKPRSTFSACSAKAGSGATNTVMRATPTRPFRIRPQPCLSLTSPSSRSFRPLRRRSSSSSTEPGICRRTDAIVRKPRAMSRGFFVWRRGEPLMRFQFPDWPPPRDHGGGWVSRFGVGRPRRS